MTLSDRQQRWWIALWIASLAPAAALIALEPRRAGLEGTVVAVTTGQPVPGAEVLLRAAEPAAGISVRITRTDQEGRFAWADLPPGHYQIEANARRHRLPATPVELREGTALHLRLDLSPQPVFLRVLAPQRAFAGREPVRIGVHGFAPERDLQVTVERYDLLRALSDGRAPRWSGDTIPPGYLQLYRSFQAPIRQRDPEGIFTQYLTIPIAGPGAYVITLRMGTLTEQLRVLVSDLALILKEDGERLLAWATDLQTGTPLAGVHLRLSRFHPEEAASLAGQTDDQGLWICPLAQAPQGSLQLVGWQERADGRHYSLIPFYRSDRDVDHVVHLITDRPIYRPGQTVFLKGIVRRRLYEQGHRRYQLPQVRSVEVEVRDGNGQLVERQTPALSDWGSFWGQVDLPEEVRTGSFDVTVRLGEETHGGTFMVAAYKKPPFHVALQPDQPYYLPGRKARLTLDAHYYFDAPVAGAQVNYSLSVRDAYFRPTSEAQAWMEQEAEYGELLVQGQTRTDARGRATLVLDLDRLLRKRTPTAQPNQAGPDEPFFPTATELAFQIQATIITEGKEYGDARATLYQVPGPYYLELEPSVYWLNAGQPVELRCQSTGYNGRPWSHASLQVLWGRSRWVEGKGGRWIQQFDLAERRQIKTDAQGQATLQLTPPQAGLWLATVKGMGAQERVGASVELLVETAGAEEIPEIRQGALRVSLDRPRYTAGQAARAAVQRGEGRAPVLLTIEGERLQEHRLLPAGPAVVTTSFPVTADYAPNVFVSACRVNHKRLEQYSLPLRVEAPTQQLTVEVRAQPETASPGDTVTYQIRTLRADGRPIAAEFSLAVVDEALFDLQKDRPEAIVEAFYGERWNRVQTYFSNPETFLQAGKGEGVALRRHFPDTAFWKPDLVTNAQGQATIQVKLPDNLTTWRATAIAHTRDTEVGYGTCRVTSRLQWMVRLQTPRFFTQRDETYLTALVHNETDRAQVAEVTLQVAGEQGPSPLRLQGSPSQQAAIPPHQVRPFRWRALVTGPQVAVITASATAHGTALHDTMLQRVPVRPYAVRQVTVNTQEWKVEGEAQVDHEVVLSPSLVPEASRVVVSVAPFALGAILPALEELADYPYGCVEQTMSRFLPDVLLARTWKRLRWPLPPRLARELPRMVREGLLRLYRFQHYDGGWGWWEHDESEVWMTAYVLDGLRECREAGFEVEESSVRQGLEFLQAAARAGKPSAYAAYVLSRWGEDPRPHLLRWYRPPTAANLSRQTNPTQWPLSDGGFALQTMSVQELACLTLILKGAGADASLPAIAAQLESRPRADGNTRSWGDVASTAWAVRALVEIDPSQERLLPAVRWLVRQWQGGLWYSTRDTALVLSGLIRLAERWQWQPPEVEVQMVVGDQPEETRHLTAQALREARDLRWVLSGQRLRPGSNRLRLRARGNGWCQYTVRVEEAQAVAHLPLRLNAAGWRLERRYLRSRPGREGLRWEPLGDRPAVQGAPVRGVVRLTTSRPLQHVIVEEPLPAGAEPLDRGELNFDEWQSLGYWWSEQEFRDDRVAFFIEHLPAGAHEFTYEFRPETPGRYCALPARLEGMYDPTVQADGTETWVEVE